MVQAMVAITPEGCTGCDLCITFCPFEALLPLSERPADHRHAKRPVVVVEASCVGCLSCIGSCPTEALHEVLSPPDNVASPLLHPPPAPATEPVKRWSRDGTPWS